VVEAFPIATFIDTVIKPQPGRQCYFEFNAEAELLVMLYVPAPRRPSFVVRERRLPSGKLLFLLFDPASTSDAEQVQAMFEESIGDLFEPGVHEWRQVTIPADESHHDRYLLAAASLTMWLTAWQQNNAVLQQRRAQVCSKREQRLSSGVGEKMDAPVSCCRGAQVTRRRANYGSARGRCQPASRS